MERTMYPESTRELHRMRQELAPKILAAFRTFGEKVFADGALPSKTKMRAGASYAHSNIALDTMNRMEAASRAKED